MNKNLKLAVAGAVLAMSASAANAGIIIPAGDWTLDINGNVNAFANSTKAKGADTSAVGGIAAPRQTHDDTALGINTGLLPSWLGFTGKTRQNDVDVEFTISMQPNVSSLGVTGDSSPATLFRQSYVSFGDKSWGSIKLGKDLGVFASDAILNDMTLLGVGGGAAASGGSTTLGGIGTGYIYAAWKGQITYTTPNFNGLQASVGIFNPNQGIGNERTNSTASAAAFDSAVYQDRFGLEGKASYSFSGDAMSGKVWVGGASYDVTTAQATGQSYTITAADVGLNVNAGNLGLTGYYYTGEGLGTTFLGTRGFNATTGQKRDSDGGYLQATYVLPTKTKFGIAYGTSDLDRAAAADTAIISKNERITVGLYHPLTKHLNLVAEYNDIESRTHTGTKGESQTGSLGAILFF
jgi:predicted porin